ncbi:hypothetical protein CFY87_05705 [Actinobacillus seminis]|uniref:Uncharacterized protein n=1 Tax=Actinobacillus seminis TaxID=722 RepID=A0ABX4FN65_9PAST|nr:hypothetical protein CFY87_05705 [Actinobacillus seminis]
MQCFLASIAQNIKKITLVIRAILYCFMAWIREYIEVYRRIFGMSVLKLVGQEYWFTSHQIQNNPTIFY